MQYSIRTLYINLFLVFIICLTSANSLKSQYNISEFRQHLIGDDFSNWIGKTGEWGGLFDDGKPVSLIMLQGDHGPEAYRNSPVDINPFFSMETGVKDEKHPSSREQVEMLKELGYDGISHIGCENLAVLLKEIDENGLRLFAIYLDVRINKDIQKYNSGLREAIELLRDRDVILWVPIRSTNFKVSSPDGDLYAVKVVREIADMAAKSGLKVSLYPHSNFWLERIEDAVRVAKKVNHKNVGVTFNLCHWLKFGDTENLNSSIKMALPYLYMVTINGADHTGDWKQLIQPLGSGSYDVYHFLKTLKDYGYTGPIGLQGWGIGGDVYQNLEKSMKAWRCMNKRLICEKKALKLN